MRNLKGQYIKGFHPPTEFKVGNSGYWLGKKRDKLTIEKIRLSKTGKKDSQQTKEKKRLAGLGRRPTEETRKKLILNAKNRVISKQTRTKLSEWNILHPNRKFKDTSIERKIEAELKQRGLKYEKQIPLCKIAIVDFLLKEINTVIQADGCFWHGCPEHNPNYIKNKNRDKNQDMVLGLNGYKVVRFWEHEINKSVEKCIDKIFK